MKNSLSDFAKKLGVASGVATALLGIATAVIVFISNMQTMQRLEREFATGKELLGVFVLYVLPSVLIALGSSLHAYRRTSWGLPLVLLSTCGVGIIFTLLLFNLAFYSLNVIFWLNLSLVGMAIVTSVVSLFARTTGD